MGKIDLLRGYNRLAACKIRFVTQGYIIRNIAETVEKYGISKPTLWRWSKAVYLPKIKLGGKCFYRESDIIKLMNEACR